MAQQHPPNPHAASPASPGTGGGRRMAAAGAILVLAGLGIGGGTLAVLAMSKAWQGQRGVPVATPTREDFAARAGEAVRNSSWREAEGVLREAIEIYDHDQELRLQLADVLRTRAAAAGWQRHAQGVRGAGVVDPGGEARERAEDEAARRQDSLDAYEQVLIALQIGPASADVEFRAGLLASECGKHEEAAEHFRAARSAAPTNAEYTLYLAQAELALNQTAEAKATLLATVRLDAENAVAWGTLADIFLRENKADLALENVRRARALQPDVTVWRLIEARALKRKGQAEEALQVLIALPAAEQRDTPVLTIIAECYALLGRPEEAAARYGAASDARPTDARLAVDAADWFKRVSNVERARYYAERASMLGDADGAALATELRGG